MSSSLYDPAFERGACGLGFIARSDGRSTREIVEGALQILQALAHRGATGADPETGDGAGILVQIPDAFLRRACLRAGFTLPPQGKYGVGTLFLSRDADRRYAYERELERIAAEEGQPVIGWRDVPVEEGQCGSAARAVAPVIRQVFIERRLKDEAAFSRALYVIRRRLHWAVEEQFGGTGCYVVSLSASTLVYKGLLKGPQLPLYYPDLQDPQFASALAVIHSRFSTNTLGSWELAHPFRYVAHNGEINALRGNVNWMRAREHELQATLFPHHAHHLGPIVQPNGSDTSAFDNALEFLVLAGRTLPHAIMTMVPEAWENDDGMDQDRRAFYQYTGSLMSPWDGPAAIAFSDGRMVGATLDRNGLRPARYSITRDGLVVLASEEGVLPIAPEDVVERWRLQPGKMLVVDTVRKRIYHDDEAKRTVVRSKPYRRWVKEGTTTLEHLPSPAEERGPERVPLLQRQHAFGYTLEDLKFILTPMATDGAEPTGSMGTDTPLAVLSDRPQLLFSYFKQLFAQVSNPPIDPLREDTVMSLRMSLGPEINLIEERPEHCEQILLDHPILTAHDVDKLLHLQMPPFHADTLSLLFPIEEGEGGLGQAVERLCREAENAIDGGASILILTDRGIDAGHAAIPSLLATAAVHHHLVREGLRTRAGLVIETGEAREVHHMALLIGYGAAAIHPYLAIETVETLAGAGGLEGIGSAAAAANYVKALRKGLLKVISKMGISTLIAYNGAQVFEAVGLDETLIDRHFTGTASRIGGIGMEGLAHAALARQAHAFVRLEAEPQDLAVGGEYQMREGGEFHQWNPRTIASLQRAVQTGNYASYRDFSRHFDDMSVRQSTVRGLFALERSPIPLSEVEPVEEIVRRFSTGAMSFGSISREAHETIALAMNRMGGKSNTGEGGEEPERAIPEPNGDSRRSAIKQVASARFGVNTHYLVNADVLQIKMAQGAKPGEGGQLPGHKVSADIARARFSTPGVGLISPPPHHDIYSIEDLAQLIHDLKNVNPTAEVSVKLVAEVGVGTIAAGVSKAKADHITIAGYDGGTGASPLSSIKHAGLPWELGLAETQHVLVANDLRGRVRVQADGGLKTGRDVVVAALLGADEFAFSTAPLVATGCIMMRACHLNTCPVGIATQNPFLRKKFAGKPEHIINYFFFLAQEVRELMAELGFRMFDEMVGRSDKLRVDAAIDHWRARGLDLTPIVTPVQGPEGAAIHKVQEQDHGLEGALDEELIRRCADALDEGRSVALELPINNTNRTVGARLSGEIARRHGIDGLPDDTIRLNFSGTAGQSFGAWGAKGLTMILEGEANDHVGKGLSGGKLIVAPPSRAAYKPEQSIVVGNVALYGATGGEAYFRGVAGERFAVRNSGAVAVVEGVGDHGCEYMTGGTVLVLGETGRNFAAGMSGGTAFVVDMWGRFSSLCNTDMVGLEPLQRGEDIALVRRLLQAHLEWTGSDIAQRILQHWREYLPRFVKIMPNDLRRVLEEQERETESADLDLQVRAV